MIAGRKGPVGGYPHGPQTVAVPGPSLQWPPCGRDHQRRTPCKSRPRCCADRPEPVAPARQGHARTAVPASPGCAPMVSGRKGPVGHCPHGPQAVAVPGLSLQRRPCGRDHQRRTGRKARCFRFTDLTQPDAAARQTRPRRGSALTGLQVDGLRGRKRPVGGCPQGAPGRCHARPPPKAFHARWPTDAGTGAKGDPAGGAARPKPKAPVRRPMPRCGLPSPGSGPMTSTT